MIGIDLAVISRFDQFFSRHGEKGLRRFLTDDELPAVFSDSGAPRIRRIAGYWAIKEAVSKALGCGIGGELGFHDMQIVHTPKGAPEVLLSPDAGKRHGAKKIAVSLTHDGDLAIAVAFFPPKCSPLTR